MNTSNTSNNSSIIAEYTESLNVGVDPIFTDTIGGVEVVARPRSVIIGDRNGAAVALHGYSESRGAMTALIDGWHIKKYAVLEVGLHLYAGFETLRRTSRRDHVGYLTSMYSGDDARLLKIRPEEGIAVLNWMAGGFKVKTVITMDKIDHPRFDESEQVTMNRAIFWKHSAMDSIINGEKLLIAPYMYHKVDGASEYSPERVEAFLAAYIANLQVTPVEASRNAYQAGLKREFKRQEGRVHSAVNTGEVSLDGVATIKVGDAIVNVNDLLGKSVIRKKGNIELGRTLVNPSNLAGLVASALALNVSLSFE